MAWTGLRRWRGNIWAAANTHSGRRAGLLLTLAVVLLLSGVLVLRQRQLRLARDQQRAAALAVPITTVTALGRLEPEGEVISVAPPAGAMAGAQVRLKELLVEEGDTVQRGQLLAVLDSLPRLNRAVGEAEAQVLVSETRLSLAKATQGSELATQQARVRRAEASLNIAAAEERRYRQLYSSGATSASLYESRQLSLESARAEMAEARSRLQRLQIQVASSEGPISLEEATALREWQATRSSLERVRTERNDAFVRAPISGRVLAVLARPGEVPGAAGILELGSIDHMQVVAEIYESDRQRLKLGQSVRITSPALTQPLHGTVTRIGAIVRRQSLINTDPSTNTDNRVIEVRARLDQPSSAQAAELSNLQVTAMFGR